MRTSFLIFLSVMAGAVAPALPRGLEKLSERIADPKLRRATIAVVVVDLDTGKTLFDRNGELPLVPASNMKLVTTAAALTELGADFNFTTRLQHTGDDIIVVADGDPAFGDPVISAVNNLTITSVFEQWSQAILKRVGNSIQGDLIIDASIFDAQWTHENWPMKQIHRWYCAPVGGLNLNDNCIDIKVRGQQRTGQTPLLQLSPNTSYMTIENSAKSSTKHAPWISRAPGSRTLLIRGPVRKKTIHQQSITVDNPPRFAGTVFSEVLAEAGVVMRGSVKIRLDRVARNNGIALAIHRSHIAEVINRCNRRSQNLFAECLLKRLGAHHSGVGSWSAGRTAAGAFLQRVGAKGSYFIDDGGGLSPNNRLSCQQLTAVLAWMADSPDATIFRESLAQPGHDHTLRNRMIELKGRLFAKTGYISGSSALSGYVRTRQGKWLAFSILVNKFSGQLSRVKRLQNAIVTDLAEYYRR